MAIQLYGFWRSNAAFRVRVALALKQLPFEEIEVDLLAGRQFDTAYAEVNAGHSVPTLVHDGQRVFQSLAIIEYLDEMYPTPQLMPSNAMDRAYVRALASVSAADSHPLVVPRVRKYLTSALGADAAAVQAWCRHWGGEGLATYERMLAERPATPFALGDAPTLADICIAGQVVIANLYQLDVSAFPNVAALSARCFAMPEFAAAHPRRQPGFQA